VAVCKDLDSVWIWFYKEVAPMALIMKWCETCGKAADDDGIICSDPQCRGHLGTKPKEKASVSQEEVSAITRHVWKKKLGKAFVANFRRI
jgi:predicted nucleic acid-binding Zn ribbon protein